MVKYRSTGGKMDFSELIDSLKDKASAAKLDIIGAFLQRAEHRESLEISHLEILIDEVKGFKEGEHSHLTPIAIFLEFDDIKSKLIDWCSSESLEKLISATPKKAFEIATAAENKDWALYDEHSESRRFFTHDLISVLFRKIDNKRQAFRCETFSFYFSVTPSVALSLYPHLSNREKFLLLNSEVMTRAFHSEHYFECLQALTQKQQIELFKLEFIRKELNDKHKKILLAEFDEILLVELITRHGLLDFLPPLFFTKDSLFQRILSLSSRAKLLLICHVEFFKCLNDDLQYSLCASLEPYEQKKLLKKVELKSLLELKAAPGHYRHRFLQPILNNEENIKAVSGTEIMDVLMCLEPHDSRIMTVLNRNSILQKRDLTSQQLMHLVVEKFNVDEIFCFIENQEYPALFNELFKREDYFYLMSRYPSMLYLLLQIEDKSLTGKRFLESHIGLNGLDDFLKSQECNLDRREFYQKLRCSNWARKILVNRTGAAPIRQIERWFYEVRLSDPEIEFLFEVDAYLVSLCTLNQWYVLFKKRYQQDASTKAAHLLGRLLLKSEVPHFKGGRSLAISCKEEIEIDILIELLALGQAELWSWLLAEEHMPKCLTVLQLPRIMKLFQQKGGINLNHALNNFIRLPKLKEPLLNNVKICINLLVYADKETTHRLLSELDDKVTLNASDWKYALDNLSKAGKIELIQDLFLNEKLVLKMGLKPLVYALNQGFILDKHLCALQKNERLNVLLKSDEFKCLLKRPGFENAYQAVLKNSNFQYELLKEQVFDYRFNNMAVKLSIPCFYTPSKVPNHIQKMRLAFDRHASLTEIKEIARKAAYSPRFFLWNTRNKEVQNFYEKVAQLQSAATPAIIDETHFTLR